MRGARKAGDGKPPTAPEACERTLKLETTYSMQDALSGTLARSLEPDAKFATNKVRVPRLEARASRWDVLAVVLSPAAASLRLCSGVAGLHLRLLLLLLLSTVVMMT
eukprot:13489-Rhodomonas_salina.1